MPTPINEYALYLGLLFGLRAAGVTKFVSDGIPYHDAFDIVVKELKKGSAPEVDKLRWWRRDPMFGTYPQASQLISVGIQGCLLTLDSPGYRLARFNISGRGANHGLRRETEHAAWFRRLGRVFAEALEERGLATLP